MSQAGNHTLRKHLLGTQDTAPMGTEGGEECGDMDTGTQAAG